MTDERDPLILPHPIPLRRHGEDGILFQPKTQLTRDELLLYAAVCEYGHQEHLASGVDPGMEVIPSLIDRALTTWPTTFFDEKTVMRLRNRNRQELIARVTSYVEEIMNVHRLSGSAQGSA